MAIEIKLSAEELEYIRKIDNMILDMELPRCRCILEPIKEQNMFTKYTRLDDANRVCEALERRLERAKQNTEQQIRRYESIIDDYAQKVVQLQEVNKKKTEWIEDYQRDLGSVREDFRRVSEQLGVAKEILAIQEKTISRHVDIIISQKQSLDSVRMQRDAAQAENQKLFDFFADEGYDISEVLYG